MTIGTRIITENRKPLHILLPLESPLVLFIDPSDACNSKCSFCPTSNKDLMKQFKRPLKQMSFELYKKIIDDLHDFKTKIKVIRLYGHGEPLLNKYFCDMVKYAKDSGKVETVDTTTNGLLLTPKLNYDLAKSGIDRINISVNGLTDKQYLEFAGIKVDFKNFVKNIKHLYENKKNIYIFIKINGDTIDKEEEKLFLDIFEPLADSVAIEKSMNCWEGFEPKGFQRQEENIGIYGQKIDKAVEICPYIYYSLYIWPTGEVSLCFLDWNRKLLINDITKNSLYDIWNGTTLKLIRSMMLNNQKNPICKNCEQLLKGQPENLDPYKEQLLKIYTI